ncbi:ADP-ribosylglycohydrolase family protein [candidate division KSB1 bacterium]|nr:ADP-ribosylglycohydrolase family protein [candidate division KSB1 bacterium]MBL7093208.1 ADP-ribosylglycohydrolase family protein [candidate division KSB1 bacterium]
MKRFLFIILIMSLIIVFNCTNNQQTVTTTRDVLLDKIRGGWVGKSYGVSFGGPTEFGHQGKIIEGPLELDPKGLEWLPYQDDMYVNMALFKAVVDNGLDATSADFAKEFAHGGFLLWHANGQGRQNILEGIPPDKSGHPLYNPHADDIDFQIECDFIGLVCPGLPQAALNICDRAGHLMNYGDGVYGGYFVTAMYAAAFIYNDMQQIVEAGFKALPEGSGYAEIIGDLFKWHKQYPLDWKKTWQELEDKYNNDLCPWGVHSKFNIQARLNGAYIALGLLYGEGDLEKTVELSTRCGQDSDCNPANSGGIVGTMLGFNNLPEKITTAMAPHMNTDFHFTPFSIESASKECLRLSLENILANGGKESGCEININVQSFRTSRKAEISFPTLAPLDRFNVTDERITWQGEWKLFPKGDESMRRSSDINGSMEVEFIGNAIYVQGDLRFDQGILEYVIDDKSMGTRDMYLPKKWKRADQSTAVWVTGLPDGDHKLRVLVTGKKNADSEGIMVSLGKVVTYSGEIAE